MFATSKYLIQKKVFKKRNKRRVELKLYNFIKNKKNKYKKTRPRNIYKINSPYCKSLVVPEKFSLISNLDSVLFFAEKCKSIKFSKIKILELNFSKVNEISDGSMAMILSVIHDLNIAKIKVIGSLPTNTEAKDQFIKSGFLNFFKTNVESKEKHKNTILVQGRDKIDQISTSEVIEVSMETVFGLKSRNQSLQGILIEMMTNSVNHAFTKTPKNTKWYLSTFHIEEENKVKFCFVDNGDGILNTIKKKPFRAITDIFDPESEIIKAFDGIYGSSTQLKERGTGLLTIKKCYLANRIAKLKVISNDLFYDFETDKVEKLKTKYSGTFYFWELNLNCLHVSY